MHLSATALKCFPGMAKTQPGDTSSCIYESRDATVSMLIHTKTSSTPSRGNYQQQNNAPCLPGNFVFARGFIRRSCRVQFEVNQAWVNGTNQNKNPHGIALSCVHFLHTHQSTYTKYPQTTTPRASTALHLVFRCLGDLEECVHSLRRNFLAMRV